MSVPSQNKTHSKGKLSNLLLTALLVLALLAGQSQCATVNRDSLSWGLVGVGVIIIGVAFILGVIVCIYGRCTSVPYIYAILGTLIPVITTLIIALLPKEVDRPSVTEEGEEPKSFTPILRWMFAIFCYVMAVVALLCLCILFCLKSRYANKIASHMSSIEKYPESAQSMQSVKPIVRNREKYLSKPQLDNLKYKKTAARTMQDLQNMNPGASQGYMQPAFQEDYGIEGVPKRRRDYVNDDRESQPLIAPEGDMRDTGKNRMIPRRLEPVPAERRLDMGINVFTPQINRRLNMVNPEQRSVRIDDVNVAPALHDSDDSDN